MISLVRWRGLLFGFFQRWVIGFEVLKVALDKGGAGCGLKRDAGSWEGETKEAAGGGLLTGLEEVGRCI